MTKHSEETVVSGLMAIVAHPGNMAEAARVAGVSPETLKKWADDRGEQLRELKDKYADELEANLIERTRAVAYAAAEAEQMAIQQTLVKLQNGTISDPHRAARDMADVRSKATDKLLSLTGRPTKITEHRDVGDIMRKLQRLGVVEQPVIEGSATEETA